MNSSENESSIEPPEYAPVEAPVSNVRILNMSGILPYAVFAAMLFLYFTMTVDDAYITFRYARNLLHGHGPVFNIGERVEGFTSPLHLLLSALLMVVLPGIDILFKAKIVGALFALLSLYLVNKFLREAGQKQSTIIIVQLIMASNVNFAITAVNGLETTLFGAMLLIFAIQLRRELIGNGRIWSGIILFICLLTRPETLILAPLVFGFRYLLAARFDSEQRHRLMRMALQFAIPSTIFFVVRYSYYGSLLPNTYYAKSLPMTQGILWGIRYLAHPLSQNAYNETGLFSSKHKLAFELAMACFWSLAAIGAWNIRKQLEGRIALLAASASIIFILRCGGDWMTGWRFMIAALPFIAYMQAIALQEFAYKFFPIRKSMAGFAVVIMIWGSCLAISPKWPWNMVGYSTDGSTMLGATGNEGGLGALQIKMASEIAGRFPSNGPVAFSEMGYVGYANMGMKFLDVHGLIDAEIARLKNVPRQTTGIYDIHWAEPTSPLYAILKRRRPDVIVGAAEGNPDRPLGLYHRTDFIENIPVYVRDGYIGHEK